MAKSEDMHRNDSMFKTTSMEEAMLNPQTWILVKNLKTIRDMSLRPSTLSDEMFKSIKEFCIELCNNELFDEKLYKLRALQAPHIVKVLGRKWPDCFNYSNLKDDEATETYQVQSHLLCNIENGRIDVDASIKKIKREVLNTRLIIMAPALFSTITIFFPYIFNVSEPDVNTGRIAFYGRYLIHNFQR